MQMGQPEGKVQELVQRIRMLAHEKGPDAKLPTARELYKRFETSWSTLNAALEELEQQHVIVRRQGSGIFVSNKLHRKTICVLIGASSLTTFHTTPFWGHFLDTLVQKMQRRITERNEYFSMHLTMPCTSHEGFALPEDVMERIEEGRNHAVIAILVDRASIEWLEARSVPVISFAGYSNYNIVLNMPALVHEGVNYLQQQGCQRIGFWSAFYGHSESEREILHHLDDPQFTAQIRISGVEAPFLQDFQAALREYNLRFDPDLVRTYPLLVLRTGSLFQKLPLQEQGYRIAMEVFGNTAVQKPDGILSTDDVLTSGALIALNELGLRVGQDVHIATHANQESPVLMHNAPEMALIEFSASELVDALFALLDRILLDKNYLPDIVYITPHMRMPGNEHYT